MNSLLPFLLLKPTQKPITGNSYQKHPRIKLPKTNSTNTVQETVDILQLHAVLLVLPGAAPSRPKARTNRHMKIAIVCKHLLCIRPDRHHKHAHQCQNTAALPQCHHGKPGNFSVHLVTRTLTSLPPAQLQPLRTFAGCTRPPGISALAWFPSITAPSNNMTDPTTIQPHTDLTQQQQQDLTKTATAIRGVLHKQSRESGANVCKPSPTTAASSH